MKSDDSSLEPEQYRTVHAAARSLLSRGDAWGRLPTPIDDLMSAAQLRLAPISAFDEGAMRRYLRQADEQVERLLRRALDKVLGIFDVRADVVHIDPAVSPPKQAFLKLHETGHKELPHHRQTYRWIQDCSQHLAPEVAALFEREANTFATIVFFQDDGFAKFTADLEFGIKVPMRAAKTFGASIYASMREYVRRNHRVCAVVVLDPTEAGDARGLVAPVRRIEFSPAFRRRFGGLTLPTELTAVYALMRFVPLGNRRMSRPDSFALIDRNGERHEFVGEGFRTPHNTFILMHARSTLNTLISVAG